MLSIKKVTIGTLLGINILAMKGFALAPSTSLLVVTKPYIEVESRRPNLHIDLEEHVGVNELDDFINNFNLHYYFEKIKIVEMNDDEGYNWDEDMIDLIHVKDLMRSSVSYDVKINELLSFSTSTNPYVRMYVLFGAAWLAPLVDQAEQHYASLIVYQMEENEHNFVIKMIIESKIKPVFISLLISDDEFDFFNIEDERPGNPVAGILNQERSSNSLSLPMDFKFENGFDKESSDIDSSDIEEEKAKRYTASLVTESKQLKYLKQGKELQEDGWIMMYIRDYFTNYNPNVILDEEKPYDIRVPTLEFALNDIYEIFEKNKIYELLGLSSINEVYDQIIELDFYGVSSNQLVEMAYSKAIKIDHRLFDHPVLLRFELMNTLVNFLIKSNMELFENSYKYSYLITSKYLAFQSDEILLDLEALQEDFVDIDFTDLKDVFLLEYLNLKWTYADFIKFLLSLRGSNAEFPVNFMDLDKYILKLCYAHIKEPFKITNTWIRTFGKNKNYILNLKDFMKDVDLKGNNEVGYLIDSWVRGSEEVERGA